MRPSTFLRSLSTKLSSHLSPSSVAPWPPARSCFAIWLTSELDCLRSHPNLYATSTWLTQSLELAITSQQMAISAIQSSNLDKKVFDRLIEDDIIDLLDACNVIRRRIEEIHAYMGSLDLALHWLEGEHGNTDVALQRASKALESCEAIEKRCPEFDSCLSSLRKLGEKIAMKGCCATNNGSELQEVVVGSRAVALLVISMATVALSFRTRRGIPTFQSSKSSSSSSNNKWWGSELSELHREAKEEYEKRRREGVVLVELKETLSDSQRLRSLLHQGECEGVREVVSELKSKCREMDEKVKPLEERVEGLYKRLIDVRICLLRVISDSEA